MHDKGITHNIIMLKISNWDEDEVFKEMSLASKRVFKILGFELRP